MNLELACERLADTYQRRAATEDEIGQRDLSEPEARKTAERELFDLNAEVEASALAVVAALRSLFEEGRGAVLPPSLGRLSRRDVVPIREKIVQVVERLQVLAAAKRG